MAYKLKVTRRPWPKLQTYEWLAKQSAPRCQVASRSLRKIDTLRRIRIGARLRRESELSRDPRTLVCQAAKGSPDPVHDSGVYGGCTYIRHSARGPIRPRVKNWSEKQTLVSPGNGVLRLLPLRSFEANQNCPQSF